MKEPTPIKLDTILAELNRLGAVTNVQDGKTSTELCDEWGKSGQNVSMILRKAQKAGILRTAKSPRVSIDGTVRSLPVYWFQIPEKAQAKKQK